MEQIYWLYFGHRSARIFIYNFPRADVLHWQAFLYYDVDPKCYVFVCTAAICSQVVKINICRSYILWFDWSNKNGLILPTGQWYALSAVINDALIMHFLALSCTILHYIAHKVYMKSADEFSDCFWYSWSGSESESPMLLCNGRHAKSEKVGCWWVSSSSGWL